MMSFTAGLGHHPSYIEWLGGWREWARTRKRGRMAQFIIEKLEEGKQAQWLDISKGIFELTEWHLIAKEWFGEKPRNSEEVDAPCMLRKGLPRAFPGLEEVKERSRKEGTQYRSRVFQAPYSLLQEVLLHINNHSIPGGGFSAQNVEQQQFIPTSDYGRYATEGFTIPTSNAASHSTLPYFSTNFGGAFNPSLVKLEYPHGTLQQPSPPNSDFIGANGEQYLTPHSQTGYHPPTSDIDLMAQAIVNESMETQQLTTTTTTNGWPYTPPASTATGMLTISPGSTVVDDVTNGFMGSPGQTVAGYHHSPVSAHSPRISPEPSIAHISTSSYPPSVADIHHQQQQPVINGPVDLSPPTVQSPIIVTSDEPEIMEVKVCPNRSPLEGGGSMALVFYQPLPHGRKAVYFISKTNPNYYICQVAIDENPHTLSCGIPKYPIAEEVELRVYCENQPIAISTFTFFQNMPPSDMLLQILHSQLQSQFQLSGQSGLGGTGSGATGGQTMSTGHYAGYIPSSMYQLLLGACRLGCEPLVYCLLCSPVMEGISSEQMKEAHECAQTNGHEELADHLMELFILHDMALPPQLISRGPGQSKEPEKHVPAYYDALDMMDQGGNTPQERAETVLKQLVVAAQSNKTKDKKENVEEEKKDDEEVLLEDDVTTPTNEISATLQEPPIEDLTKQLDQTKLTVTRKISGLKRQTKSISDGDVDLPEEPFKPSTPPRSSRGSLSESGDEVGELPYNQKKHPFYQHSDADSAIGMSFEEDCSSMIFSEVQRRRSSSLLPIDYVGQSRDAISIKLPQDAAIEVASSLEWESNIVVIEDYPPNQEFKIFHKGDRIIQVGDRLVRNMSVHEFSDLFHSEAANGMTLKIIPNMEKPTQPSIEPTSIAMLRRTPSEQNVYDNIKTKINQLLSMRPPNSERTVTIPRSPNGFGFKMIGGKTVGVFISDIRADVTQVYSGDQILNINGHNTQGLTLYDASQLLQSVSGDLQLTVVENRAKFLSVREQVELDSLYLRSCIDHTPTSNREMTLKKGSLLRVVNTFVHAPNYWLAWAVDERTGVETQLKRIPSPVYAQRQFGHEVYERVQRSDVMYRRPVCIVGPQSDTIAENLSKQDGFSLCKNIEQVLGVCAKGSYHAVYSVSDKATLHLLTALQPIVLQTPTDTASLMEQVKFTKITVDGYLSGNKKSDLVSQAIDQVHQLRSLPVWRPMGIIH